MKFLKNIVICILASIVFFSIPARAAYDPRTSIEYDDILAPFYIEKSLTDVNNISGDMITYALRATPKPIWDLYFQEGVRIYITQSVPKSERKANSTFSSAYDGVCYAAKVYYDTSSMKISKITAPVAIYIYSNATRADTYYHECGHALDNIASYITGYYKECAISSSSEWQSLYNNYGSILAQFDNNSAVNMYNSAEAFAEAYRLYFSYPSQLQANCPEVYTFISNQISIYTAYVPPLSYDNFDYRDYAFNNPDVYDLYGYDKKALWNHYINFGINEGRQANKIINVKR